MKRTSAVLSIVWTFVFLTFFVVTPGGAQGVTPQNVAVSEHPSGLEGNWSVVWHDYPEKGQDTAAKAVLTSSVIKNSWCLDYTQDLVNWGALNVSPRVDQQGNLEIQWGDGGGRHSTLKQTSPHELRGRWSSTDRGGEEVWSRALPRITGVVFKGVSFHDYSAQFARYDDPSSTIESETTLGGTPGRVEGTYGSGKGWGPGNDRRYDRPKFKVQIYSKNDNYEENLWGHHRIDVGGAVDLEPSSSPACSREGPAWTYIMKGGGGYTHLHNRVQEVEGIELEVVIWPNAKPGKYALRVDGFSIPFELVIKDYPSTAAKVAEIKFVRKTDQGIEAIPDKTLRGSRGLVAVEAEMDSDTPPEDKQRSGKLALGEGPNAEERQLDFYRESARIFRSQWFRIEVVPSAAKDRPAEAPAPEPPAGKVSP